MRRPTTRYFHTADGQATGPDVIRLRISPRPGASFHLFTPHAETPSQIAPVTAATDFPALDRDEATAYEQVLTDVLCGDSRRLACMDPAQRPSY